MQVELKKQFDIQTFAIRFAPLFICLIFVIKLGDSLYIRPHGDALGYHLYAPLLWAKYGWGYVSGFQVMQYQSGLWEMFLSILFKIWPQENLANREFTHIFFQVFNCAAAFLFVPFLIWRNKHFDPRIKVLVLLAYFGAENMLWTSQYAKNDALAMAFFVWAFMKIPRSWGQILLLSIAVAIKPTYLYGAMAICLCQFQKGKEKEFLRQGFVLFFPMIVWIRSYWNTGNPFFPIPSAKGLQISDWQKEYFKRFTDGGIDFLHLQKVIFYLKAPAMGILALGFVTWLGWQLKKDRLRSTDYKKIVIILVPFFYFLMTGIDLEPRTFAGVFVISALVSADLLKDCFNVVPRISLLVFLILGLATSKVDPSSWKRWFENKNKTYDQMVAHGTTLKRINELSGESDLVLTLVTNEGWYLKPVILTVNEHAKRDLLMAALPVLNDSDAYVLIRQEGCDWTGSASHMVERLLGSHSQITQDAVDRNLYHLKLDCLRDM